MSSPAKHVPAGATQAEATPLRFVTAASLFDGHDAAINIMRRIIQSQGAEVIHLGHNRSVEDVVRAALAGRRRRHRAVVLPGRPCRVLQVHGRHAARSAAPATSACSAAAAAPSRRKKSSELQAYGVERIYHPNDGMKLGLTEMIEDVMQRAGSAAAQRRARTEASVPRPRSTSTTKSASATCSRLIEEGKLGDAELARQRKQWKLAGKHTPVLGITGTGGAGKSSVVDELLLRFLHAFPQMRIAVLAVDPDASPSAAAPCSATASA